MGLAQAYLLRNLAADEAVALGVSPCSDAKLRCDRAKAIAALVASWEKACERIRIFKGKPLPGSKRPAPEPRRPRVKRSTGTLAIGPVQPSDETGSLGGALPRAEDQSS